MSDETQPVKSHAIELDRLRAYYTAECEADRDVRYLLARIDDLSEKLHEALEDSLAAEIDALWLREAIGKALAEWRLGQEQIDDANLPPHIVALQVAIERREGERWLLNQSVMAADDVAQ